MVGNGKSLTHKEQRSVQARLNTFALTAFRNSADNDYIAARFSYRAGLYQQFMWSGLQAIEKYLKCILLLNRIPKPEKPLNHDIVRALDLANEQGKFTIRLRDVSKQLIEHINRFGKYRYGESSWYLRGHDIQKLDMAVWDIRRYCQVLDYSIKQDSDSPIHMLSFGLKRIEEAENNHPYKFKLLGGLLEAKLKGDSIAKKTLVWKNFFLAHE